MRYVIFLILIVACGQTEKNNQNACAGTAYLGVWQSASGNVMRVGSDCSYSIEVPNDPCPWVGSFAPGENGRYTATMPAILSECNYSSSSQVTISYSYELSSENTMARTCVIVGVDTEPSTVNLTKQ